MATTPSPATTEWVPLWDLAGGGSNLPANVALTDKANIFTKVQTINLDYATIIQTHTSGIANSKSWQLATDGTTYQFQVINDLGTVLDAPIIINRNGDTKIRNSIYEKGRNSPIGHWIAYTPSLYSLIITTTYTMKYMLIGKTIYINFYFSGSITAAPPVALYLPSGFISAEYAAVSCLLGGGVAMAQVTPGGNYINFYANVGGGAIPVGAYMIAGLLIFEIQ